MNYVSNRVFDGKRVIPADRASAYPKVRPAKVAFAWQNFSAVFIATSVAVLYWARRHGA